MTTILLKLIWQVDYANCLERTFLYTDTAAAAESLGDEGFVAFHTDSFHSTTHHRTVAYAEMIALLDFAFVNV